MSESPSEVLNYIQWLGPDITALQPREMSTSRTLPFNHYLTPKNQLLDFLGGLLER